MTNAEAIAAARELVEKAPAGPYQVRADRRGDTYVADGAGRTVAMVAHVHINRSARRVGACANIDSACNRLESLNVIMVDKLVDAMQARARAAEAEVARLTAEAHRYEHHAGGRCDCDDEETR